MPYLLLFRDGELLTRIPLVHAMRVGRSPGNDATIPDKRVSRQQCAIIRRDDEWVLSDRSGRGTSVNDRLIHASHPLNDGDSIALGAFVGIVDLRALECPDNEVTLQDARGGQTKILPSLALSGKASLRLANDASSNALPLQAQANFRAVVGTNPEGGALQVRVADAFASASHFSLSFQRDGWTLRDLGSQNGTWVDGVRVVEAVLDRACGIRLGETIMLFAPDTSSQSKRTLQLPGFVTQAPAMKPVIEFVRRVAPSVIPVSIHGESGSGKEVVARAIHALSERRGRAFVALNCGALPRETLESELFGHERGAFTGADRQHRGAFEEADGGTLFLDEIGDLPLDAQVKLLRTLETGEVRRVGGSGTSKVSVRIISASHKDLGAMVVAGTFREDLYYRLCVAPVELPPLRQRPEDIMPLVEHFTAEFLPGVPLRYSSDAEAKLRAHAWPGNAREVRNVVQLALLQRSGLFITPNALNLAPPVRKRPVDVIEATGRTLEEIEREAYRLALARHSDDRKATMEELGVPRSTFFRKLDDFGLNRKGPGDGK